MKPHLPTRRMHPGRSRRVGLGVVLGMALIAGAGCEERVVGTRNPYIGGTQIPIQPAQPPQQKGFLDNLGDTMFGWMNSAPDDPKRGAASSVVDPKTRLVRPAAQSSQ